MRSAAATRWARLRAGRAAGVTELPALVGGRVFQGRTRRPEQPCAAGRRGMKAKRAYEVKHTRGNRVPALIAEPSRVDHVEVVEIDSGEVVLFWDLPTDAARRVVRQMRQDPARARRRRVHHGLARGADVRGG